MITLHEVELLAALLARAGVTEIEAMWANVVLGKLRKLAIEAQEKKDDSLQSKDHQHLVGKQSN